MAGATWFARRTVCTESPAPSASGDLYWGGRSQIDLFGNSQGVVDLNGGKLD
jgi:hypothetical protein